MFWYRELLLDSLVGNWALHLLCCSRPSRCRWQGIQIPTSALHIEALKCPEFRLQIRLVHIRIRRLIRPTQHLINLRRVLQQFRQLIPQILHLVNLHLLLHALHLLGCSLHGRDHDLGVFEAFGGKVGLFQVEGLLLHETALGFVLFLLLEDAEGLLFQGGLGRGAVRETG